MTLTNEKILKMLDSGKTDELKILLQNEIYIKKLNRKTGADKRFKAMMNYFKLTGQETPVYKFPYRKEINGIAYSCFTDGYSSVLSREDLGNMELYDEEKYNRPYFDIEWLFKPFDKVISEKFNAGKVLAAAKSLGYKFNKSSLSGDKAFILEYKGAYFNIGLLDKAFGIIDDGEEAEAKSKKDPYEPIVIENSIGKCLVLPIRPGKDFCERHKVIYFDELI